MEYKLENGNTVLIKCDEFPKSPRTWGNLAKIICFHSRYNIGEKHDYKHGDYSSYDEMAKDIIRKEDAAVIMPVYIFDHGNIEIATTPFSCPWDSGQIGWVVISKDSAKKEYGCKRITAKIKEILLAVIKIEVETYSQYISGEVYGFIETDTNGVEVNSCYGFYGLNPTENGMSEYFSSPLIN